MSIKVAITDDHPLAVNGISMMLNGNPDIEVTATYNTGAELMEGLAQQQPDVLLLDIMLPDKSGKELAPVISKTYPDVRIIALSSLDAPAVVRAMLHNGCLGYLLKGTNQPTLLEAIEHVYRNEEFIQPTLKEHLLVHVLKGKPASEVPLDLTNREKEVLQLVVDGATTQEIANTLFISPRTAEAYRLTLLKKLEVKNTAGLVRTALTLGLAE